MVSKATEKGSVIRELNTVMAKVSRDGDEPLTSFQVALAAKAALDDFVGGKTSVQAIREVGKLLSLALKARAAYRVEDLELTSGRAPIFY